MGVALRSQESNTGKAAHTELFFDLIFVAAMYRLGAIMSDDVVYNSDHSLGDVAMLFNLLFLTWHHHNMLMTRFQLLAPWNMVEYLYMMLCIGLTVTMARYDKVTTHAQTGLRTQRFQLYLLSTRVLLFVFYAVGSAANKAARKMGFTYCMFFLISVLLNLVAAVLDNEDVYMPLTIGVACLEWLMYPVSLLLVNEEDVLPIDVEHNIERAELWTILVCGETMLSLVHGSGEKFHYVEDDPGFYLVVSLGFVLIITLMGVYLRSQPEDHSGLDTHSYDLSHLGSTLYDFCTCLATLGLFGLGVGLKLATKYGRYHDGELYLRNYAYIISGGVALALLAMTLSRFAHEWAKFGICGTSNVVRHYAWMVHIAVAICTVPMAMMISTEPVEDELGADDDGGGGGYEDHDRFRLRRGGGAVVADADDTGGSGVSHAYEHQKTGTDVAVLLVAILAGLFIVWLADIISSPTDEVREDLHHFQEEMEKIKSGKFSGDNADIIKQLATKALADNKVRGMGQKKLRFSSKYMGEALSKVKKSRNKVRRQQSMSLKRNIKLPSEEHLERVDLFEAYRKILDRENPNDVLSSENISKAAGTWKRLGRKASMMQSLRATGAIGGGASSTKPRLSLAQKVANFQKLEAAGGGGGGGGGGDDVGGGGGGDGGGVSPGSLDPQPSVANLFKATSVQKVEDETTPPVPVTVDGMAGAAKLNDELDVSLDAELPKGPPPRPPDEQNNGNGNGNDNEMEDEMAKILAEVGVGQE